MSSRTMKSQFDTCIKFQNEIETVSVCEMMLFIANTTGIDQPPHDKTIKVTVRPAKPQISLGIRPVLSDSSLCA